MKSSFKDLIDSPTPTLIDFYADWCGPCKMMPPILKEVKDSMGDSIRIVKIDTERNQQLSASLGIRSIPTLIVYKEGKEVWRQAGVVPAPQLEAQLRQFV
ncbi:MAG: thioredoxin [Flavobacteriales bacterium]|nr:thioredoxin [Flavobacteriales bacterium]